MLFFLHLFLCFFFSFCTDYYLRETGGSNTSFTTWDDACDDINYVLETLVNVTDGDNSVYVDSGRYSHSTSSSPYFSTAFRIEGDVHSSLASIRPEETSTYPVLLFNTTANVAFFFSSDVIASFLYLSFLLAENAVDCIMVTSLYICLYIILYYIILYYIIYLYLFIYLLDRHGHEQQHLRVLHALCVQRCAS
jgi:hypothetical protein